MEYPEDIGKLALFKNEEKKSDNAPDYSGVGEINDAEVRIAGWINESASGKKYISIKVTPKVAAAPASSSSSDDDGIDF